jgi:hypothetical protein
MGATTAMDAAGGGIKAGAAFAAGSEKDALEKANAGIADQQAKSEMAAGGYNTDLARKKAAQIQGNQVSAIGANNLQQGGTNANVVADTAKAQEANALQIQNNALRRAWGFEVQGASDTLEGSLAKQGGILSGLGDLTSTAGKIYKDQNTGS